MRNYRMSYVVVVMCLAFVVGAGCQPSETQADNLIDEPAVELEPVQPEVPKVAESEKPEKEIAKVPSPKIILTKSSHDFGKIGPSSSHVANYEFKNEGEGVLLVKRVQSTCGCSKPTLIKDGKRFKIPLKDPVAFESGESGKVEVTYKSSSVKGTAKKHLYIESNDPKEPRAQLELTAETVVKVSVEPEKVDLKLNVENAGMPDIVVKSSDGQEFSIASFYVAAPKAITVPFDPEAKATEFTLKPKVDLEALAKTKTGIIQIKTTHPESGTLMVRYNVKPMYELSHQRYILQNVEPGKPVTRDNIIRSNYGDKVEIESATSKNGYMEIVSQEPDGNHLRLTVEITPPEHSDTSRRYITDELTITLKDKQKLTLRCSGWFKLK